MVIKRIIVTKNQLNEYFQRKKSQKIFEHILEDMYENSKKLNENISLDKANQSIIEYYKNKKLLTPKVIKLLKEHHLMSNNNQIL